ncbi:Bifunctional protein: zinc-containing alcohol dehydrogenase; quinone oxidoreductase (NADPH:quinone reductase); Similar to arginate lyase [hydrothermal vent metagenome]|uniref:Bifunctional protein: zinc-containing alcohol dehydrogenase quinone oxidoreductase ( NADPH:quinone reductase) Similar to arginate lyase n=1 Tax=hydrothermal vent metagenome TaxID=652676 RepID=A0A3B1DCR1_9ZZZZ
MKAIVINRYGSAEVLEYKEFPLPQVKPSHLLVRIHATSVNPVDFKIRRGEIRLFTGLINPRVRILGFDVAGEVVEVGKRVKSFRKGDQLYAFLGIRDGGAYAEYTSVPERSVAIKPANMSFEEAAAVPLASLTALQALRDKGKISAGKKVLINGASGGVGTFAVQIAKASGAVVAGVCSSKNIELVQSLGADSVIDYTKKDFTEDSQTYDIIYDVVANKSFSACKKVLTINGIYITTIPDPKTILQKLLTSVLPGKKAAFIMVKANSNDLDFIKDLIEAGKIKSVIDKTFPLSQVAAAHTYCEAGHSRGKNVITTQIRS